MDRRMKRDCDRRFIDSVLPILCARTYAKEALNGRFVGIGLLWVGLSQRIYWCPI